MMGPFEGEGILFYGAYGCLSAGLGDGFGVYSGLIELDQENNDCNKQPKVP
jgi:hypothetical protein